MIAFGKDLTEERLLQSASFVRYGTSNGAGLRPSEGVD